MRHVIVTGPLPSIPRPALPDSLQRLFGPGHSSITARVRRDRETPTGLVCEVCVGPKLYVVMARCRVNERLGVRLDRRQGDCPHVDFVDIAVPPLRDNGERMVADEHVLRSVDARLGDRFTSVSLEPEGFDLPGHLLTVRSSTSAPIVVVVHEGEAVKLDHAGVAGRAYLKVSVPHAVFGRSLIVGDPVPANPVTVSP